MVSATAAVRKSDYRFEHFIFSGMAFLILTFVFVGFSRTHYLARIFKAPLPNPLVHIHGAVFTTWILLLVTQTSLVAADRVDIHRRLGLFGFGLACVMVILGLLVATDSLIRHATSPQMAAEMRTFYATPLAGMVMFSTLIYFAFRNRFNPAAHKRLILIANLAIVDAALDRWPVPWDWWTNRLANLLVVYPILLLLMLYDWWSTKRFNLQRCGRRFPCNHAASGQTSRLALRAFSVIRRLDADSCTLVPIKDEPNDDALFGEKTELPRIGKS
jgi:hypothetical protein